jgi:3-hydroxyacyl-[acyl-carrier-protein] dehydratase
MLQNDFFTITDLSGEAPSFKAILAVNAQHRIFEGHFPGQPVVPGVCLMQMVLETAETALGGGRLKLLRADQLKFIALIDPGKVGALEMKLDCKRGEDGTIQVVASLTDGGKLCFKFSGVFVKPA